MQYPKPASHHKSPARRTRSLKVRPRSNTVLSCRQPGAVREAPWKASAALPCRRVASPLARSCGGRGARRSPLRRPASPSPSRRVRVREADRSPRSELYELHPDLHEIGLRSGRQVVERVTHGWPPQVCRPSARAAPRGRAAAGLPVARSPLAPFFSYTSVSGLRIGQVFGAPSGAPPPEDAVARFGPGGNVTNRFDEQCRGRGFASPRGSVGLNGPSPVRSSAIMNRPAGQERKTYAQEGRRGDAAAEHE